MTSISSKKILLDVQNLWAGQDEKSILRGVNLTVHEGELHLILGLNGSGKSTFGKVLLGHPKYKKTKGKIFFLGEEISEIETYKRAQKGIFLSHQTPPEVEGVSAKDLLRAAEKAMGKKTSILSFKQVLKENLQKSGLSSLFLNRPMNIGASGGERKKMEIASLLTLGARLAFLDEIDSGVDVDAIKSISEGIKTFLKDKKNAVILISHSSSILQYISPTSVHIFCGGHISYTGGKEVAEKIYSEGFGNFMNCSQCQTSEII